MLLPRAEVIPGYLEELDRMEALVRSLTPEELATPTRCAGWSVADVVAHVVGTLTDVANMDLDGIGEPEHIEQTVIVRRGRSATELADELAASRAAGAAILATIDDEAWVGPALTPVTPTLGDGVMTLWYDTYVHLDDIHAALGRPSHLGLGLTASLARLADLLAEQGWGPATLSPTGLDPVPVGAGGPSIAGDPLDLLLAGTGRIDTATVGADPAFNVYR